MIYTIGYGNLGIDYVLDNVVKYDVALLVDVRSKPYSSRVPGVNKEDFVKKFGCSYIWCGDVLGGIDCDIQDEDLRGLVEFAECADIMLMCAEFDYRQCHRDKKISQRIIQSHSVPVVHIMGDKLYPAETQLKLL